MKSVIWMGMCLSIFGLNMLLALIGALDREDVQIRASIGTVITIFEILWLAAMIY